MRERDIYNFKFTFMDLNMQRMSTASSLSSSRAQADSVPPFCSE